MNKIKYKVYISIFLKNITEIKIIFNYKNNSFPINNRKNLQNKLNNLITKNILSLCYTHLYFLF